MSYNFTKIDILDENEILIENVNKNDDINIIEDIVNTEIVNDINEINIIDENIKAEVVEEKTEVLIIDDIINTEIVNDIVNVNIVEEFIDTTLVINQIKNDIDILDSISKKHIHENFETLEKFSEEDDILFWNDISLINYIKSLKQSVDKNIIIFDGITGNQVLDSGINISDIVLTNDSRLTDTGVVIPHAELHSIGKSDAISPISIGAANIDHDHDGVYDLYGTANSLLENHLVNYNHNLLHDHSNIISLNKISETDNKPTWNGKSWEEILSLATVDFSGLMSFTDKIKLDSIVLESLYYTHPLTHPATIIEQTEDYRFVTDIEKSLWNSKWTYDENAIKNVKVNSAVNADNSNTVNNLTVETAVPPGAIFTDTIYEHPLTHPAAIIIEDATHRFVTDSEKVTWNDKWTYNEEIIKNIKVYNSFNSDNSNTVNNLTVLTAVPENALFTDTIYEHPLTHPATIIIEDNTHRFTTDIEKSLWNSKWTYDENTIKNIKVNSAVNADNANTVNNLTVLTAVPENALFTDTIYTHPSTHPATMIVQDTTRRFVSDFEKTIWNNKWAYDENTIKNVKVNEAVNSDTVNNLTVLTAVPENALFTDTIYMHPLTHPATMIGQDTTHRFVTDAEKYLWNNKWTYNEEIIKNVKVNESSNSDTVNNLTVLTAVPENALFTDTIYMHPLTHPATMIGQDTTHRFVTDAEKYLWNNKWTYNEEIIKNVKVNESSNSDTVNNLTVLTAVPENALFTDTIYEHPLTHPATIIVQTENYRFVSDIEKNTWNSKWAYDENTIKNVKVNEAVNSDTVNNLTVLTAVPENALFTDTIYMHPLTHPATMITEDNNHLFVTSVEKSEWNSKWAYDEETIKNIKVNSAVNADNSDTVNNLTVLTAVPENALFTDTIYTHPLTHSATIIVEDDTHRFVTDSEKILWNSKWVYDEETIKNIKVNSAVNSDTVNNLTVLTAVPENALFTDTIYEHPLTHPATMITEDNNHLFVTSVEKLTWNDKWTYNENDIKIIKVNNAFNADTVNNLTVETAVPENALFTDTIYIHPLTHSATIIVQDATHRFVTDSEKSYWNNKWTYNEETIKNVKVNEAVNADTVNNLTVGTAVPVGALFTDTIYEHPGTHPATMIVQDETHRFVTDSEKNFWSYKWTYDENTIKNVKVFNSFNSDLVDGKDINDYYNKNEVDTLISRFIYYQPTPMLDWLITHNLNRFPSSVVITDSAGSVVEGAIQYIDVNNIKVSFNYQFSGTAFIA
jgi:predicted NAD/FAD-binding protein